MYLTFFGALALVLFGLITTIYDQQKADTPAAVLTAGREVDQYRTFMYVASLYMRNYSGGAGTITWNTLKTIPGAPSGAINTGMPAGWKLVVAGDATWVACTEMSERATGIVQQLAVRGGQSMNNTVLAGTQYVVVGQASETSKAALCD